MPAPDIRPAIDAIWRIESSKVIGALARFVRDVGLAEDLAHDALVTALEEWPRTGVPRNPGAWLTATARRRAIDRFRHDRMSVRKHEELRYVTGEGQMPDVDAAIDDDLGDDALRLMFIACHPVVSADARVALTLRLLGGLTTGEIARAFLLPEATVAQRIVRAKKALARARVPFELPAADQRRERLGSVLGVVYLIFNEGYAATSGDNWTRPELCDDAMRLGRVLAERMPDEAEVHGLVALMELQASRLRARTTATGEPILLLEQNRARWDPLLIRRGLAAQERAEHPGGAAGPYTLQAAIAACHARARTAGETDWRRIVELYERLALVMPSPVVALNHAVAVSMAFGPATGLELVDELAATGELQNYHLLPAVRGDLLLKLGRLPEAREAFGHAASLTRNTRERDLLLSRAQRG